MTSLFDPVSMTRGPGLKNTDVALIKRVFLDGIRRGMNLELRLEGFNVFNVVNYGVPNLNIASGTFGRIGSTATEMLAPLWPSVMSRRRPRTASASASWSWHWSDG
mgnify:CR=1 FL=1